MTPAPTPRQLAMLVAVAAVWGAAFLFIRIASPVLGPVALVEARMGLAGLLLLVYAFAIKQTPPRDRIGQFVVLGALWAAPFVLIALAELNLTASLASVINATTPMFSAMLAVALLGERLTAQRAIGLLVGIGGVGVVVGWAPLTLSASVLFSAGASLLAAMLYALGGIYAARHFKGVSGVSVAAGQQVAGAMLLLPLLTVEPPGGPVTQRVSFAVLALAIASTAIGFVLFFRLLDEVGPTSALTTTYLVPVFGIAWGAMFLGEPVEWSLLGGLAVILLSVALVTGLPKPGLGRPPTTSAPGTRKPTAPAEQQVRTSR